MIAVNGEYWVPAVSLDELIQKGTAAVPDIVKMDVEGAELLLNRRKTVWLVAMHGEEQKRRCQSLLTEAGYRLYSLDGTEFGSGLLPTDEIYAVPV